MRSLRTVLAHPTMPRRTIRRSTTCPTDFAVLAPNGESCLVLEEAVASSANGAHASGCRRHLIEGLDVHQPLGVEVAEADGAHLRAFQACSIVRHDSSTSPDGWCMR